MTRIGSLPRIAWTAVLLSSLLLAARCPAPGQTFFVSDEASPRFSGVGLVSPVAMMDATAGAVAEPAVVEGDLFRVLTPDRLLNLNAYRGLQVIDLSDATQPKIIGRLPLSGTPVELYVVGDVAYVLLNGWSGYPGAWAASHSGLADGASVVSVDLSDPANPVVIDQAFVAGDIETSRLTRAGDRAALYVVARQWSRWTGTQFEDGTIVTSFDVAGGVLAPAGRIDLGGAVSAVHATPALLLVAHNDSWGAFGAASRVSLIDITDPSGAMEPGGEVEVGGWVQSQFNMDHRGGVLRIASGGWFGNMRINHLQTFDVSDPSQAVPIDAVTFGASEDLFATIFLDDRAFFVTYRRVDPFHAFEIDDDGVITAGAEFVVSGWNDFFRPVLDDTRLLGIGVDDTAGQKLAVSLYDVTSISNPEPLLARESVAASGAWSEARFDHRAFSVIEDAVSLPAPGGAVETGLLLLPFTSWNEGASSPVAGVQLFTFSASTLTRRGVMQHGSPVRRSFEAGAQRAANLSETELTLFATANPEQPRLLGRLDLAPNYTDVFRFGDHWVRVLDAKESGFGYWNVGAEPPPSTVEVVPGDADPDLAEPVAHFEISSRAALHQSGALLVGITPEIAPWTEDAAPASEIAVYDLSDPAHPKPAAKFRTTRLEQAHSYGLVSPMAAMIACYDCFAPQSIATSEVAAIPGGLAFLQGHPDRSTTLDVLDLRDPEAPRFADPVALGAGIDPVNVRVAGGDVWAALKQPGRADRRGRGHARYFASRVDVSNVAAPIADEPINVPGELIGVAEQKLFTRDLQWNGDVLDTAVVRLAVEAGMARVEAVRWFEGRNVEKAALDGAGHVLVSHGPGWYSVGVFEIPRPVDVRAIPFGQTSGVAPQQPSQMLTVLDAASVELDVVSESKIESGVSLLDTIPGRALYRVVAGLLVLDLEDAAAPEPRAFFATPTLQRVRIHGRSALSAGGRYGIRSFDLDAANLPRD